MNGGGPRFEPWSGHLKYFKTNDLLGRRVRLPEIDLPLPGSGAPDGHHPLFQEMKNSGRLYVEH